MAAASTMAAMQTSGDLSPLSRALEHLRQDADAEYREARDACGIRSEAGRPEHDEQAHSEGESEEDPHVSS